jgi:trimeric autotransporter adhesin
VGILINSDFNIDGQVNAAGFARNGGVASEFLKADGSVDSNNYITGISNITEIPNRSYTDLQDLPTYDNYVSFNLQTNSIQRTTIQSGGTLDLIAGLNISLSYGAGGKVTITNAYTSSDTLQSISDRGSTTTNNITANSFIKTGGTSSEFLKADGSVDSTPYVGSVNGITGLWKGSQSEYDLLTPDPNTVYYII